MAKRKAKAKPKVTVGPVKVHKKLEVVKGSVKVGPQVKVGPVKVHKKPKPGRKLLAAMSGKRPRRK